jgi:hypothetical protein
MPAAWMGIKPMPTQLNGHPQEYFLVHQLAPSTLVIIINACLKKLNSANSCHTK